MFTRKFIFLISVILIGNIGSLHSADIFSPKLERVKRAYESGQVDINAQDEDGDTPLTLAASEGNEPVVEYLVGIGADLNIPNAQGQTARQIAQARGNDHILRLLS